MSAAQEQALLLTMICCVGSACFLGLTFSSRGTRFSAFAALNLLLAAALFGVQAVFGFANSRSEIIVAGVIELPAVFLISWVCLAQAGGLSARFATLSAGPVARRPRLRATLKSAPVFLILSWILSSVVGLIWPSPAMQTYAPAPPQLVLFKSIISGSEAFYAGLAAGIFAMAARSAGLAPTLRLKNFAFSVGMLALMLVAVESMVAACVRAWASGEDRRAAIESILVLEAWLAAICFLTLAVGLALRYTPVVTATLLRNLHNKWLPSLERFEALKWRALASGTARGSFRVSYHVERAAELLKLSGSDTEKALATIQLLVVMRDPSTETEHVTPEAAQELYTLQKEVLRDDALALKIDQITRSAAFLRGTQTGGSVPLSDTLEAALDLIEHDAKWEKVGQRPLWYHLVAVSAADMHLLDSESMSKHLGQEPPHQMAAEAYCLAVSASRLQAASDEGNKVDRERRDM